MVKRLYQYNFGQRQGLILQIDEGWGEIAPLAGFSRETFPEAFDEALAFIQGKADPKLPSVRFGVDCASKPLSKTPLRVPLCALNEPREGVEALKLKLGNLRLEEAIALVKKYKDRFRLRLDCNRSWTLVQALAFADHFSASDFEYLEEPVTPFADLIRFSKITKFPIAVDESLRDSPYLEIPTLKAAIVKPTLMGGIPNLSVPIILSSSYESSLGLLHIARLAPSNVPQGLDTFQNDLLIPPLEYAEGHLIWNPTDENPIDMKKLCLIASAP